MTFAVPVGADGNGFGVLSIPLRWGSWEEKHHVQLSDCEEYRGMKTCSALHACKLTCALEKWVQESAIRTDERLKHPTPQFGCVSKPVTL